MSINSEPIVNFEKFDLDFINTDPTANSYNEDTREQILSDHEVFEQMESSIPTDGTYLGVLNDETDSAPGYSWKVEDHYYIIPYKTGGQFEWALFRISWDDNYGCWGWQMDARVSGIPDKKVAAITAMSELFNDWGYDLKNEENEVYRDFLNRM